MYEGARNVDRKWLDVARAFSASPLQRFRKVILHAMVPYAFTAARVGLGQALRGMVVAELFVLVGIGGLLFYSGQEVSTAGNFALLFILMAIALAANGLLGMAEKILAPWQGEARLT